MSRKTENTAFCCHHCGSMVPALTNGSYRNHCPFCLYSQHVDNTPGDRESPCQGPMQSVGVRYHSKKGYQLLHRCEACGVIKVNRVALDGVCPDDLQLVIGLLQQSNTNPNP